MTHSILKESPPPVHGKGDRGDHASNDRQSRSLGAALYEEESVRDSGDPNGRSNVQPRWIPRLLTVLFVACLLFAAWVWYQIFRFLS